MRTIIGNRLLNLVNGCFIWGAGSSGLVLPVNLDKFRNSSPSWALDIEAFGPWISTMLFSDEKESRFWVSEKPENRYQLILTGSCSAAMDVAWRFISKKILQEWGSVLSLNQWRGRGQLGRTWVSALGNIYSATRFPLPPSSWENLLPLIVAYSLVKSFARINIQMAIKWPNDLILGGKKVGGILVEIRGDSAVVGVGINLLSSPGEEMLRNPRVITAASLIDFGYEFTPLDLWQNLLGQCQADFTRIVETKTPSGFITEIHDYLAFKNEKVHLIDRENKTSTAILMGLAENGGLKLLMNDKIQIVQSGSICPLN